MKEGRPSVKEAMEFWTHMPKKGLIRIAFFLLSFVLFLFVSGQLILRLSNNSFDIGPSSYVLPGIVVLAMVFFYYPSLPGTYERQFKAKLRPDISKAELNVLLTDMLSKSLYLASIAIFLICILCVLAYALAGYPGLSNVTTSIMVVATMVNVFLISLVAGSLGGYNREFLRRTFIEEEYSRSTSIGSYKRIYALLLAFNTMAIAAALILR